MADTTHPTRLHPMQLGERIAQGRQAEIFAIDRGRVLKLMRASYPHEVVAEEARRTALIHAAGFPVPEVLADPEPSCGAHAGVVLVEHDRVP